MKSIHPPLYVLVATVAFFLGANVDLTGSENSDDAATTIRDQDAISATQVVEDRANPRAVRFVQADTRTPSSVGSDSNANRRSDQLALVETGDRSGNQRDSQKRTNSHSPVLKTKYGDVAILPANNPWNQDVTQAKVHPMSKTWIKSIGWDRGLHPDFGTVWDGAPNGIPFVVVDPKQAKVAVEFEYDDESDPGPYPIPSNAPIEGGPNAPRDSDRHVIVIDAKRNLLYELFHAFPTRHGWKAGSGAIFDLTSNKTRPKGWTSADAAGLPIFPGLVRYDEVAAGEIRHALRFTVERTQRGYIFPARHFASRSDDPKRPPMGLRIRLRADYDIARFPRSARVILQALKTYGMLLADNGSNWFISGAPDPRWNDDDLATIKRIRGRDLECVITGPIDR